MIRDTQKASGWPGVLGQPDNWLRRVEVALQESSFEFFLTGSYFFGCATRGSDVDLIVQYSPEVIVFLVEEGFERLGKQYDKAQLTDDTVGVYELEGDIHIQVVRDVRVVCLARDILSSHFADLHKETRGPDRRDMWNAAIRCAKQVIAAHANYNCTDLF